MGITEDEEEIRAKFEAAERKQRAEGKTVKDGFLEKEIIKDMMEEEIAAEDQRQMEELSTLLRRTDDKTQNQQILMQLIKMTVMNNSLSRGKDEG